MAGPILVEAELLNFRTVRKVINGRDIDPPLPAPIVPPEFGNHEVAQDMGEIAAESPEIGISLAKDTFDQDFLCDKLMNQIFYYISWQPEPSSYGEGSWGATSGGA